ncbi:MAG: HAMP domain-containing histidine kinase [Lachnospiraceae bacterium]|nr:HAMP domain-containing histidine kinase [Lachnospiraceae bacterium]
MTSIARRINWSFWGSKFASFILFDMFFLVLFFSVEGIEFVRTIEGGVEQIIDVALARDPSNEMSVRLMLTDGSYMYKALRPMMYKIVPYSIAIAIYQAISLFFSMFRTGRIRRKLQPLNDLASRAEVISNIPLDDTHLENLERAIRGVSGNEENIRIETQDKDLQGIESALNGLLSRMKEAQMQQTRFVSDASHELRTPIAVVQGYVNMLDRWGKEDPAVLNESIEALKHESQYMKDLVEQLLFLARGDSGRNNLKLVDFDLKDVVREVFEESMMIDADHEYRFVVQGVDCTGEDEEGSELILSAAPQMFIRGDVSMIKQSLRIFVQNASKYTEKGNTITLGVNSGNGMVSYMVQDEGTGIEAEDIRHIFERFYRSDKARNGKTGGSGLGLSIAKWIVDAHDGRVDVVSRTELGTRFTVSFPEQTNMAELFSGHAEEETIGRFRT